MTEHVRDSHCSFCGTMFTEQKLWPRKCFICYNDSYKNPIPVVQILYAGSTKDEHGFEKYGLLVQQRNIEPKKGEWALPGGYINLGETWQQAAARELEEETGLITDPNDYVVENLHHSTNGNLLIFVKNRTIVDISNFKLVPNHEVQDAKFIFEPMELAFPTHNEELNKYMKQLRDYTAVMIHGVFL